MTWEPPEAWEPVDEFDWMVYRMSEAELASCGTFGAFIMMLRRVQRDLAIRCLFLGCGYKDEIVEDSQ